MPDFDFLRAAEQLAAEFRRRGMDTHLACLRRFYADQQRRRAARAIAADKTWDETMVIGWLGLMRIPPFELMYPVLPQDARCPKCSATNLREAPATFTRSVWPGGSLQTCRQCDALWLVESAFENRSC